MKKILNNIIIFVISLFFSFILCYVGAEVYFYYRYGAPFSKKSIWANPINRQILIKKQINRVTESKEFYLSGRQSRPTFTALIKTGFMSPSKNFTVDYQKDTITFVPYGESQDKFIETTVTLDSYFINLINSGFYSLAVAVTCEGEPNSKSKINIFFNHDTVNIESPIQLYPKDILMAVLPYNMPHIKDGKMRLRIIVNNPAKVMFKNPRVIISPVYPPLSDSNYREQINIRKSDKIRIIAIGGSTTFGVGSQHNTTWPSILQQRLNYVYPDKFEVINVGTWGANSQDLVESFEKILVVRYAGVYRNEPYAVHLIPRYNFGYKDLYPDIVLAAPCWNDISESLTHLYYDKPFLFGLTYREADQFLGRRLCRNALGFFIYRAVNMIMFSQIPAYSTERNLVEQQFEKVSFEDSRSILRKVKTLTADSNYVNSLKGSYKHRLLMLAERFKKIHAYTHFVSLPTMAFVSSEGETIKCKEKIGWNNDLFLLHIWGYKTGGSLEREAMREIKYESGSGFSDILTFFRNYPFEEKTKIFTDLIHFSDLGNNYISAILFHDLDAYFKDVYKERIFH